MFGSAGYSIVPLSRLGSCSACISSCARVSSGQTRNEGRGRYWSGRVSRLLALIGGLCWLWIDSPSWKAFWSGRKLWSDSPCCAVYNCLASASGSGSKESSLQVLVFPLACRHRMNVQVSSRKGRLMWVSWSSCTPTMKLKSTVN